MQLPFQNTTVYKSALKTINEIVEFFNKKENCFINSKLEEEAMNAITNIAKSFSKKHSEQKKHLRDTTENIYSMIALLDVAESNNLVPDDQKNKFVDNLTQLARELQSFESQRKKVLILSAEIGQGHMSASKAVKEAIEFKYGYDYDVEIIDFIELLDSILNVITKKNYENLVKFAPSIYKFIYESTNKQSQVVKLLNQINYPFVLSKFKKFFEEKNPDILISTFPIWNYLTAEIWKKHRKNAKFISIVTDSISIHNGWIIADTDYHIVANEDTAESLRKYDVPNEKIKILGFPVRLSFLDKTDKKTVLQPLEMDPKKFTILFLPTSVNYRKTSKIIKDLNTFGDKINIIIITGRDIKLKPKIEKMKYLNSSMKVLGWTDKMHDFIKASDLVITKAGGATVMECIAAGKPTIITSIIPGQEEGNADLIKKHHLGIIADQSNPEIAEHIKYIQEKYDYFSANIQKQSNPESAIKIAEFIHSIL